MAVRPIDGNELLGIERLLDTDVVRQSKTASWLLDQVLHDIQAMPTIDPETLPIVHRMREELRNEIAKKEICAETIERLDKQLAKVTEERDAAVSDLRGIAIESYAECMYCLYRTAKGFCWNCNDGSNWTWRGTQKEE